MGSDLLGVRVLERSGAVLRVRYAVLHPDAEVASNHNFALQTIVDLYWRCCGEYLWHLPAAVREKVYSLAKTHPLKEQLERWVRLARGGAVELTPEEYASLPSRDASARPRYVSWEQSDGRYLAHVAPDYQGFMDAASDAIASVAIEDPRKHPRVEGEDDSNPGPTLVVTVTDEALLHHVFEGLEWASRIYDFEGHF